MSFLKTIENTLGIELEAIEISYGKNGWGAGLVIDYPLSSFVSLLSSIGFELPNSGTGLANCVLSLAVTYERSRGTSPASYALLAKVGIKGPVNLNAIIDLDDFPELPDLDEVELIFELGKGKSGGTYTANSTEDITIEFKAILSSATAAAEGRNCVLEAVHSKSTSGTTTTTTFVGSMYSTNGNAIDINFGDDFPVQIDIKDLFFTKISSKVGAASPTDYTVFGAEVTIDAEFDLGSIPVIGKFLGEAQFSFNSLRFTYSKANIPAAYLPNINAFLSQLHVPTLTIPQPDGASSGMNLPYPEGFNLQGELIIGDNADSIPLFAVFGKSQGQNSTPTQQQPANPNSGQIPSNATKVGKKYGPLIVDKVGLGLSNGKIDFKFTGGIKLGPLELDFIGLELATPVHEFDPSISIQGLGAGITKPPLTIKGTFMEGEVSVPIPNGSGGYTPTNIEAYNGSLTVGYKQYSLALAGSYAQLPDKSTTAFIYGFLGTPLGGPPIFFVTGVAAGFGYNRSFQLPKLDSMSTFPLIKPVMPSLSGGGLQHGHGAAAQFDPSSLNNDFPPEEGEFWGAVGVRGESFKMVENFVLLDVRFGQYLEIDILGLSNMTFPKPKDGSTAPPLAKITIGIIARIIPEEGVIAINGAFQPGSYVMNPLAKISGGFGLLIIWKQQNSGQWNGAPEGLFVFTLGGYASNYPAPAFYPKASRLQLQWKVSSILDIKAQAYFAITPRALMAGGSFSANLDAGCSVASLHVAFIMGANFIVYWKPFFYQANIYVDLSVAAYIHLLFIHAHINFDLSANLNVWGPSFTGTAAVHVHILISFTVNVSFGDAPKTIPPISWPEFKQSFLPAADKMLSSKISAGLISSQSTPAIPATPAKAASGDTPATAAIAAVAERQVVNAKDLAFTINTAIPIKSIGGLTGFAAPYANFGIQPMDDSSTDFSKSELTITFQKKKSGAYTNMSDADLDNNFSVSYLTRNLPSALWSQYHSSGEIVSPQTDLTPNMATGVVVKAKSPTPNTSSQLTGIEKDNIYVPAVSQGDAFSYNTGFTKVSS